MTPRFDAIGLVVADMSAVADVGPPPRPLPFPTEADDRATRRGLSCPAGYGWLFDTVGDRVHSFDPEWHPHRRAATLDPRWRSCAHISDEVDAAHAGLIADGYRSHVDPWDAFWGQRYATVLDPDDNPVEPSAPLPGTPTT